MPRYYFDVVDGVTSFDTEGMDCASAAVAKREALQTAGALLRDRPELWHGEPWKLLIRDARSGVVGMITFTAVWDATISVAFP